MPLKAGYFGCVIFSGARGRTARVSGEEWASQGGQTAGFILPINRSKPGKTALARRKPDFVKFIYFLVFATTDVGGEFLPRMATKRHKKHKKDWGGS